ncbi:hypothetical protein TcBrA4_0030090 [Trypanosoma cruzi]|nr:hypothetical protein TcBrA4_0030090 [Trypanosoma cruzi]
MLHASRLAWGPFVLNTRVIPDWWQSFQREDQHRVARARATQLRTPRDESRQNEVTPITLREAEELVKTYTRNHNAEDLSWIVQYIRETMGEPLNLLYYHSLFRVFNYTRDKENIEQLLHVITESGEADMGTYALVVDALHCLSPVDTLARIMRMIAVTQTSFGTLLSESGCPLLTSLLHHLANTGKYPSTASLLVVLWIRALGAQLCDWDYVHVLSALLSHPDDFPQIRSTLGAFSDFSRGTVSPEALFKRLEDRGELSPPSSPLNTIVAGDASITFTGRRES